jgi:hypothetical protein
MEPSTEKKRRGRKAKIDATIENTNEESENVVLEKIPKKRGRKPKGGKVVTCIQNDNNNNDIIPNIILHLKCNQSDINNHSNKDFIDTYQFNNTKNYDFNYLQLSNESNSYNNTTINTNINTNDTISTHNSNENATENNKIIWQKLELQKIIKLFGKN